MTFSRRPPPKHLLDAWEDDTGNITLPLTAIVAAAVGSVDQDDLDELLARDDGRAQFSGRGQLEGNFFHTPILNETTAADEREVDGSSRKRTARVEGEGRERRGKRSKTSTREGHPTTLPEQLPTPSPEPSQPEELVQRPSESPRPSAHPASSSSRPYPPHTSTSANNNPASSSTLPPPPPQVGRDEVVDAATSGVLRWREQMKPPMTSTKGKGREQAELTIKELKTTEESSTRERQPPSSSFRPHANDLLDQPIASSSYRSRALASSTASSLRPTPPALNFPKPSFLPDTRRLSSSSSTAQPYNSFAHSNPMASSSRSPPTDDLGRSNSSSTITSVSFIARQAPKDDFFERKKRDSYVGPVGITNLSASSPPTSPVRLPLRQRAVIGGRIEKSSRRLKAQKSPKKLPLAALVSLDSSTSLTLTASTSATTAAPSTPVARTASGVRDFFTSFIKKSAQPKQTALIASAPAPEVVAPVLSLQNHVPGAFPSSSSNSALAPTPSTLVIDPPVSSPRAKATSITTALTKSKPSAVPATTPSLPTYRATTARQPFAPAPNRSVNFPPRTTTTTAPLASSSKPESKPTLASSRSALNTSTLSHTSSTTYTVPKPFHFSTTITRPPSISAPVSLPHQPGFLPSFEASHALEQKRAEQRRVKLEVQRRERAETERRRVEQEEKVGKGKLFGGLERRMRERGVWEEEQRRKEEEVVRRRGVEEGERLERERLQIIKERQATVIKANPVPEMYRRAA